MIVNKPEIIRECLNKIVVTSELSNYIKSEYLSGKSTNDIAMDLGISKAWVGGHVYELGIMRTPNQAQQLLGKKLARVWSKYEVESIKKDYLDGMSISELMEKYHENYYSVNGLIKESGIMRNCSDAVKTKFEKHPEIKESIRQALKGTTRPKEIGDKIRATQATNGYVHSPETRAKMSKSHTGVPLSPEHKDHVVRAIVKASHQKPNFGEIALEELIFKVSQDFKYNGGGELGVVLGGKVPDFVNINGKKQVILFNGCYWHGCPECYPELADQANEERRNTIVPYESLGYSVLVVWEHEMFDTDAVIERIKDFVGVKTT